MATDCQTTQRKRSPEVVKSAVRVVEILELFDRNRQSLLVGEIAAALQYPQSSTSALLRSLVKVGYLTYDVHMRTFLPTQRVALLGGWQANPFFMDGPILEIARQISMQTDLPVGIFRRNHTRVQWLHTISEQLSATDLTDDEQTDLLHSSTGFMLLSHLPEREIQGLVRRINSEVESLPMVVRPTDVMARIDEVRRDGYASTVSENRTTISVLAPFSQSREPIVLTLFGETLEMANGMNHIVGIIRETIALVTNGRASPLMRAEPLNGPAMVQQPNHVPVRLAASA